MLSKNKTNNKSDHPDSDMIHNIRIQIEDVSKILSQKSGSFSEKDLRKRMHLITARIIALTALHEGDRSPIPNLLQKEHESNSFLTEITIKEIEFLKSQLSLVENPS
ncbi:hypothetical protein [Candidatus Liberibacter sp.]|uniref:hypothetical protein n=1 Tax=Candidatus Liberibacter sp. TaxID=34022 RepID=UPI0015F510C4|nr:hypothetical protein [Candidatus Liberibacter sp.]MBA5724557.1 hypothetical protein [Candidatus Liberibacter sp.]